MSPFGKQLWFQAQILNKAFEPLMYKGYMEKMAVLIHHQNHCPLKVKSKALQGIARILQK